MPSLKEFLPAVYPVGVTDLRPFLREKSIFSTNLYRIPTKFGVEMHFHKIFICTEFQLD